MSKFTKAYEALLAQYSDMVTEAARMVGGTDPLVERLKSNIFKLNQIIVSDMHEFEKIKSEYN